MNRQGEVTSGTMSPESYERVEDGEITGYQWRRLKKETTAKKEKMGCV